MYTDSYLLNKDIKLFIDDKQILNNPDNKTYPSQETHIIEGERLLKEEDYEQVEIDYNTLKGFFISIGVKRKRIPFTTKSETFYFLAFDEVHPNEYGDIPSGHKLIFNSLEMEVILKGPKVKNGKDILKIIRSRAVKKEDRLSQIYKTNNIEQITIKEIAFGISSFGELVCLNIGRDMPRIGMAGESGQGKTWFIHRLKDCFVEKSFASIIEINDRKMETDTYVEPWKDGSRFSNHLSKINEVTKPMPMIYLHPKNNKLNENSMVFQDTLGFTISIPFKEIMKDLSMFSCYYDLGKSKDYFIGAVKKDNSFFQCITLEQMEDYIDKAVKNKIIPTNSRQKIKTFLSKVWGADIFDISNGINPKWKIVFPTGAEYEDYPWIVCLVAGLSTSIETSHILKEPYYPILLNFFIKNIFDQKLHNPLLKDFNIMVFADEIKNLVKNRKAFEVMDDMVSSVRSSGGGTCIATQFYDEILPSIRTNLSHFFVFKQNLSNKGIKNDWFANYPHLYKKTFSLKNRECIACGDFVLYNPITGKKSSNNGRPLKVKLLPPNSKHHAPPTIAK